MNLASTNNVGIRGMGTEYGFGEITYTKGILLSMTPFLNRPVCTDLMKIDSQLLLSKFEGYYNGTQGEWIISECGATIESINDTLWPFQNGPKGVLRYDNINPNTNQPYRMLPYTTGYHKLAIGVKSRQSKICYLSFVVL